MDDLFSHSFSKTDEKKNEKSVPVQISKTAEGGQPTSSSVCPTSAGKLSSSALAHTDSLSKGAELANRLEEAKQKGDVLGLPSTTTDASADVMSFFEATTGSSVEQLEASTDPRLESSSRMYAILQNMNEEQLTRFEFFRRSHFNHNTLKQLLEKMLWNERPVLPAEKAEMTIIIATLLKLRVGELVAGARAAAAAEGGGGGGGGGAGPGGEGGPLRPRHLREAYRRDMINGRGIISMPESDLSVQGTKRLLHGIPVVRKKRKNELF